MNIHPSARFTRAGRALLVERVTQEHWSVVEAAEAAGVGPRQVGGPGEERETGEQEPEEEDQRATPQDLAEDGPVVVAARATRAQ